MTTHQEAAEQLRAIRSIMERATIFRALSGEAALMGGAVSLAAGWLSEGKHGWGWASAWLVGLAIALLFGSWQFFRTARLSGRTVWNHGLRVALRGSLPSLFAGGFLGLLFLRYGAQGREFHAASMWILHYGLALMAIREFAPKSMAWLGMAFVASGIGGFSAATFVQAAAPILTRIGPSGLMAATFGGLHLIYGAAIVTTSRREPDGE
ncbi:MFS family permease [Haloferula luteola]|uniref:MFS family permease n=1 Tax=Haloferula luteola TaxID=595692 RepID=A0A840VGI0_9BACT|nr:hypothetical protein [Haloferula luteola]MBB5352929.1 MFS family permease [Haloferula luteola]